MSWEMLSCREQRTGYITWHQVVLNWSCLTRNASAWSSAEAGLALGKARVPLSEQTHREPCWVWNPPLPSSHFEHQLPTLFSRPHKETCFLRSPPSKSYLSTHPADLLVRITYYWAICDHRSFKYLTKDEISKHEVWLSCFLVWKQHVFLPTDSSKKTRQERMSCVLTKIVLLWCSSHKHAYCLTTKPYLADKSFHNSHRIHNGKHMVWMLLKGYWKAK